jgi:DNA helicase-2/ATP-dependent DNA helicase PcrA
MTENILSGLNERQTEAVIATEGYVRIITGAGSGKTRALACRYAYLVCAAGVHPGSVLCVTFTNKAANEMKRRVRSLAGDGYDTSLITTYHGFCARVLREHIGRLFYPENFRILDISDQKTILEEIYS